MYLWLLIFWTQAHKEERFLFPAYPLIVLAGALALDTTQRLIQVGVFIQTQFYLSKTKIEMENQNGTFLVVNCSTIGKLKKEMVLSV